jgi:signal transduction histidine kinase
MRRIITELRPGILDELGLAAALEWQGQEFQNRTGIHCSVCVQDASLDRDRSSALFRIVQESLTNVARHAEATAVEIRLNENSSGWNLEVADNGKGMTDLDACSRQSFGLLGMQERAVAAGGTFQVTSKPGQGTKILVQVPSLMNPHPV